MIYIVSFNKLVTGGTESLHQLAFELQKRGCQVSMYYLDAPGADTPQKFQKYKIKSVNAIEDLDNNWVVVPESRAEFLKQFYTIKKCIWWLSLDNYLNRYPIHMTLDMCKRKGISCICFPIIWLLLLIKGYLNFNQLKIKEIEKDILHFYNCEYVHEYLINHHINKENILYLCGPLSDEYLQNGIELSEKEDIILYNPQKGYPYTKKVIKMLEKEREDIKIYPIKNMTSKEIIDLMKKSKVYIDFGNFPGPERIPREAVMMGCNIITSMNGSAANEEDVLINKKYKFKTINKNIQDIVNTINELLEHFGEHYPDYDAYREKIVEQKKRFGKDIDLILSKMDEIQTVK